MLVIIHRAMPVMIEKELHQGMAKLAKSLFQFSKPILPEPSLGNNKEGMFVKHFWLMLPRVGSATADFIIVKLGCRIHLPTSRSALLLQRFFRNILSHFQAASNTTHLQRQLMDANSQQLYYIILTLSLTQDKTNPSPIAPTPLKYLP